MLHNPGLAPTVKAPSPINGFGFHLHHLVSDTWLTNSVAPPLVIGKKDNSTHIDPIPIYDVQPWPQKMMTIAQANMQWAHDKPQPIYYVPPFLVPLAAEDGDITLENDVLMQRVSALSLLDDAFPQPRKPVVIGHLYQDLGLRVLRGIDFVVQSTWVKPQDLYLQTHQGELSVTNEKGVYSQDLTIISPTLSKDFLIAQEAIFYEPDPHIFPVWVLGGLQGNTLSSTTSMATTNISSIVKNLCFTEQYYFTLTTNRTNNEKDSNRNPVILDAAQHLVLHALPQRKIDQLIESADFPFYEGKKILLHEEGPLQTLHHWEKEHRENGENHLKNQENEEGFFFSRGLDRMKYFITEATYDHQTDRYYFYWTCAP